MSMYSGNEPPKFLYRPYRKSLRIHFLNLNARLPDIINSYSFIARFYANKFQIYSKAKNGSETRYSNLEQAFQDCSLLKSDTEIRGRKWQIWKEEQKYIAFQICSVFLLYDDRR